MSAALGWFLSQALRLLSDGTIGRVVSDAGDALFGRDAKPGAADAVLSRVVAEQASAPTASDPREFATADAVFGDSGSPDRPGLERALASAGLVRGSERTLQIGRNRGALYELTFVDPFGALRAVGLLNEHYRAEAQALGHPVQRLEAALQGDDSFLLRAGPVDSLSPAAHLAVWRAGPQLHIVEWAGGEPDEVLSWVRSIAAETSSSGTTTR